MAAVPFGFSVGDFVACIEVVHKATQALRRSSGAQGQFQQAIAELESLELLLRKVQGLSPTVAHSDTIEAVRLCAFKCHPPLAHFLHKIEKYERRLEQSGPGIRASFDIVGAFWKIKWATCVEEEVLQLKNQIGPMLAAINGLLQVEGLDYSRATNQNLAQLLQFTQDVCSRANAAWLAVQSNMATSQQIDQLATNIGDNTQVMLQQIPTLATRRQIQDVEAESKIISSKLDATAAADQVDELTQLFQASQLLHHNDHLETINLSRLHQEQLLRTDQKIDNLHAILSNISTMLPSRLGPIPAAVPNGDDPATEMLHQNASFSALHDDYSASQKTRLQVQDLLDMLRRVLVSAVFALAFLLPIIQTQMRVCMTLFNFPKLLSGNSIALTDALGRTKLLPYEFFCDWNQLQPWIRRAFRDLPGERHVARGDFAMFRQFSAKTGGEITAEEWERSVFAGDRVVMSMLVERRMYHDECERCGTFAGDAGPSDWNECVGCGRVYNQFYLQNRLTPLSSTNGSVEPEQGSPSRLLPMTDDHDDTKFSRVHCHRRNPIPIRGPPRGSYMGFW